MSRYELDWAAQKVAGARDFGAAMDVVELGAGDFSRSLALGERHPRKRFLSTDYTFANSRGNLDAVAATANVRAGTVDARTIDLPAESVDLMFSIALMEHIAELPECLEAVNRVLRPGGVYFYIQAPFWSCAQGHHFRHGHEQTYDFIPKYSHLTHDRDEFESMLRAGPPPPFDIETCGRAVFDRPDLSRLGLRQTRAVVEDGPLTLERWIETPDRRYDEPAARASFPRLRFPFAFEELAVSGAEVTLRKPRRFRQWLGRQRRLR